MLVDAYDVDLSTSKHHPNKFGYKKTVFWKQSLVDGEEQLAWEWYVWTLPSP